jgi:hypothetical protein
MPEPPADQIINRIFTREARIVREFRSHAYPSRSVLMSAMMAERIGFGNVAQQSMISRRSFSKTGESGRLLPDLLLSAAEVPSFPRESPDFGVASSPPCRTL